jgi:transposase, IS30 family
MAKRRYRKLTDEMRREIYRLRMKGLSHRQIAVLVGHAWGTVQYVLAPTGGVVRAEMMLARPEHRLSLLDRVEIYAGVREGATLTTIAARIGFTVSTVSREVGGVEGRASYQPVAGHQRALDRSRRPKATKLAMNPILCARVVEDLTALWSPDQIARRLRVDHPDDETMRVSHETIYKSIYVQGRGELRRELAACLRTGRAQRQPRGRLERRGRIPDMVSISERPAEAEDRAVPGHWEGDLIVGRDNKSAIGTLVERSTRFVMLLHLPDRHGALEVREAMAEAIQRLPGTLQRSITWDQGGEM